MNDAGHQQNLIVYHTADGQAAVALYARDGNVWMNQNQLAELFATSVPNINLHISNLLKEKELDAISVIKDYLITAADANAPNMNLTAWKGRVVRKGDITTAKNYLNADEVDSLNRLTIIFLETAELRVKERKDLTIHYWRENVDKLLAFNDKPLLTTTGRISHAQMEKHIAVLYEQFDARRKQKQALETDARELQELDEIEKTVIKSKRDKP